MKKVIFSKEISQSYFYVTRVVPRKSTNTYDCLRLLDMGQYCNTNTYTYVVIIHHSREVNLPCLGDVLKCSRLKAISLKNELEKSFPQKIYRSLLPTKICLSDSCYLLS